MKCPYCGFAQDRVVDSRESKEADSIRRRRECERCNRRFTTYERIDEVPYMVIKKDGRREKFDRSKVLNGLMRACEKRPISMVKLSDLVNQVEVRVTEGLAQLSRYCQTHRHCCLRLGKSACCLLRFREV